MKANVALWAIAVTLLGRCGAFGAPPPAVEFTLKQDSKVSIAIFDEQGQIVRQLLLAEPRKSGANRAVWDGLDEANRPVAPGKYAWKLLSSGGLKSKWIGAFGSGLNPGHQIMPGNHSGTTSVALADNGDVFAIAGMGEAVYPMARITRAGKAVWYSDHLVEGVNDCGSGFVDGKLYCLLNNGKLVCLDAATGKGLWKKDQGFKSPGDWWRSEQSAYWLSARVGDVVLSNKDLNLLRWVDPADGNKLDEATIDAPRCVATDGKGNVFVISGDKVFKLSRQEKTPRQVIAGLTDPARLDVDPVSGEILVAERGAGGQVKRISPEGKLLATYGRKGGRQHGAYKPEDFRHVTGITADGHGGFIVAEGHTAPPRTAFFDKDGKHVNEWYGGLSYSAQGMFDPHDLSSVWFTNNGDLINAKIDYEKGSIQIRGICAVSSLANGMVASGQGSYRLVRHDGKLFAYGATNSLCLLLLDEKAFTATAVMTSDIDVHHAYEDDRATPQFVREAVYEGNIPKEDADDKIPGARRTYVWNDLNGDGAPQRNEMTFSPWVRKAGYGGLSWVDSDLNYYLVDAAPQVLRPKGKTQSGMPIYGGWNEFQDIGQMPPQAKSLFGFFPSCVAPMPGGVGYMGYFNSVANPFGKGLFSDSIGGNYVARWDKNGKLLWVTGRHSADFGTAPGEARIFGTIAGFAHDCIAITDWQCYFDVKNAVYVWDKDGLWVGRLLDEPDLTAAPADAYVLCTENYGGDLMQVTEQNKAPGLNVGDVVFAAGGQNKTIFFRITGWDTFARQNGSVDVSAEQVELAKRAAHEAAVKRSTIKSKAKAFTASTLPRLTQAPAIDGVLDDPAWKSAGVADDFRVALTCEEPAPQATRVVMGYDDKNLYIGVRCDEPNMAGLKDFARQQGDPVHTDDSVELFVDRMCDRANYLQIIVNTNGVNYTAFGWTNVPVAVTTKVRREKDAWTAEVALPWAELAKAYEQGSKGATKITDKAPQPGEKIGFNAVRTRYAGGENFGTSWSPLFGNFHHSPAMFGTLYTGTELPQLARTLSGGGAAFWSLAGRKISLDGKLDDWTGVKAMRITDGAKLVALLYLGWQNDELYAAFDVKTDRPWKNTSSFEMAFNGGAAVDINIGPVDASQKMAPGTARYLAAPLNGKAELVEFLAQLAPGMNPADAAPRNYHTPAQGDAKFARVAVVSGSAAAQVAPNGSGYVVEMKIPPRGGKLQSGRRLKLDATVILADPDGSASQLRIPWYSTAGDDMFVRSDVVVETTLRPANWGVAELE